MRTMFLLCSEYGAEHAVFTVCSFVYSIWYQTVLMDVWRPFLGTARQSVKAERDFSTAAFDTSLRQLKRLILLYRRDYETTNCTMLITPGYVSLINEVLRHSDAPDAHVSFILAMRGCLAVAPWCRGLNGISKALISLASQVEIFERPGWAVDTIESVRAEAFGLASDGLYNSAYPIDLDLSREDIAAGSVEVLTHDFQELALIGRLKHRNERREEVVEDHGVWKGDPRDLTLTLSEATRTIHGEVLWPGSGTGYTNPEEADRKRHCGSGSSRQAG